MSLKKLLKYILPIYIGALILIGFTFFGDLFYEDSNIMFFSYFFYGQFISMLVLIVVSLVLMRVLILKNKSFKKGKLNKKIVFNIIMVTLLFYAICYLFTLLLRRDSILFSYLNTVIIPIFFSIALVPLFRKMNYGANVTKNDFFAVMSICSIAGLLHLALYSINYYDPLLFSGVMLSWLIVSCLFAPIVILLPSLILALSLNKKEDI